MLKVQKFIISAHVLLQMKTKMKIVVGDSYCNFWVFVYLNCHWERSMNTPRCMFCTH